MVVYRLLRNLVVGDCSAKKKTNEREHMFRGPRVCLKTAEKGPRTPCEPDNNLLAADFVIACGRPFFSHPPCCFFAFGGTKVIEVEQRLCVDAPRHGIWDVSPIPSLRPKSDSGTVKVVLWSQL